MYTLEQLGWESYRQKTGLPGKPDFEIARVAVEHKHSYELYSKYGSIEGVVQKKFLNAVATTSDLPKVGDWVHITKLPSEPKAIIEKVLPRATALARNKTVENRSERQVLVANIDTVFIVQGLDENFSAQRFSRFLIMVRESEADPIIVLNKVDIAKNQEQSIKDTEIIAPGVPIITLSGKTQTGLEEIKKQLAPGMTFVFVGVSGVGKSTIINALLESEIQSTGSVREKDSRGRHTTTRREMILLPHNGILIDTPGLRDLQPQSSEASLSDTYSDVYALTKECRFRDCDHTDSAGCALLESLEQGHLDPSRYTSFMKLIREQQFQERKHNPKQALERKAFEKKVHKRLKDHYKAME